MTFRPISPATLFAMHILTTHRLLSARAQAGLLGACALGLGTLTAADLPAATDAWRMLAEYRFAESADGFRQQGVAGYDRAMSLGHALALLNQPPITQGRFSEVRQRLRTLIAARADDDTGIAARYFLVRMDHLHDPIDDRAEVARDYREFIASAAPHPLAEQAVPHLILLLLYDGQRDAHFTADAAEMEALTATLTHGSARRDAHLALGDVFARRQPDPARSLRHLQAALATGEVRRIRALNNLVIQIAETARELGDVETARIHYRRFLAETVRDNRRQFAGERLAALEATGQ